MIYLTSIYQAAKIARETDVARGVVRTRYIPLVARRSFSLMMCSFEVGGTRTDTTPSTREVVYLAALGLSHLVVCL